MQRHNASVKGAHSVITNQFYVQGRQVTIKPPVKGDGIFNVEYNSNYGIAEVATFAYNTFVKLVDNTGYESWFNVKDVVPTFQAGDIVEHKRWADHKDGTYHTSKKYKVLSSRSGRFNDQIIVDVGDTRNEIQPRRCFCTNQLAEFDAGERVKIKKSTSLPLDGTNLHKGDICVVTWVGLGEVCVVLEDVQCDECAIRTWIDEDDVERIPATPPQVKKLGTVCRIRRQFDGCSVNSFTGHNWVFDSKFIIESMIDDGRKRCYVVRIGGFPFTFTQDELMFAPPVVERAETLHDVRRGDKVTKAGHGNVSEKYVVHDLFQIASTRFALIKSLTDNSIETVNLQELYSAVSPVNELVNDLAMALGNLSPFLDDKILMNDIRDLLVDEKHKHKLSTTITTMKMNINLTFSLKRLDSDHPQFELFLSECRYELIHVPFEEVRKIYEYRLALIEALGKLNTRMSKWILPVEEV